MKANKLTKVLLTAGLVFSIQSQATDVDLGLNFATVADVAITQDTALDFGSDLIAAAGSACTMAVDGTAVPDELTAQMGVVAPAGEHATYADLSGDCDATAKGTPGVYTISGAPGQEVTITLNPLNGTDLTFVPSGVASDYDGAEDGDLFTAVPSATATLVDLAGSGDTRTDGGFPTSGQVKLFVGGIVTAKTNLAASTAYTEQFVIDANYN